MPASTDKHWYALYTKARNEKKVLQVLTNAGYEAYLPLKKTLKIWSDRKKWVEEPLLPSYVFVRIPEGDYLSVLKVSGIIRFIMFSGKIAQIPDWQIQSLIILLSSEHEVNMIQEYLQPGQPVEVISGPLSGMRGEIIEFQGNKRVVLRISHIGLQLDVGISAGLVRGL